MLEVVSVAGAKTFSLQTPGSPSRTENSVSFSAGIPSPGYNGPRGGVGRITFKAKTPGSARITVASGKVLLNDGNATDVFDGTTNALITITAAPKKETPVEVVPAPTTETPATVTPTETLPPITPTVAPVVQPVPTQTISIKVSDLFTLIYVLIGIIVLLAISVLILVLLLLKKNKKIK